MDAPRVDELLSRAIDDQVAEYREWRMAMDALGTRVESLEAAVRTLCDDLDDRVGIASQRAVAQEVEQLSSDIRRQISDLGRLIVNDLGRLPTILREGHAAEAGAADHGAEDAALDLRDEPGLPYAEAQETGGRRGRLRRR